MIVWGIVLFLVADSFAYQVCVEQPNKPLGNGGLLLPGQCADVKTATVDMEKYLGKWYEYARYPVFFEPNATCVTAQYSQNENGQIDVVNEQVDSEGKVTSAKATAEVLSDGKLAVKFNTVEGKYWILACDPEEYSVVYSCSDLPDDLHTVLVWVLLRQPQPNLDVLYKALKVIMDNGLPLKYMTLTNCKN